MSDNIKCIYMRYFVLRQKRTNAGITWFLDVLYRNKTNCAGVIILVIAIVALFLFLSTVCFMVHYVDMTLKYHIWPYSFILDLHFEDILKISAKWFKQWSSMIHPNFSDIKKVKSISYLVKFVLGCPVDKVCFTNFCVSY